MHPTTLAQLAIPGTSPTKPVYGLAEWGIGTAVAVYCVQNLVKSFMNGHTKESDRVDLLIRYLKEGQDKMASALIENTGALNELRAELSKLNQGVGKQ